MFIRIILFHKTSPRAPSMLAQRPAWQKDLGRLVEISSVPLLARTTTPLKAAATNRPNDIYQIPHACRQIEPPGFLSGGLLSGPDFGRKAGSSPLNPASSTFFIWRKRDPSHQKQAIPKHLTYSRAPRPTDHPSFPPMSVRPPTGPVYPPFKRRIPDRVFYLVPAAMWLALSLRHRSLTLPSAANPALDAGGLWGESKSQGLALFGPTGQRFLPPHATLDCLPDTDRVQAAMAAMRRHDLIFPVVAKPDRGYQGWGVRLLASPSQLADYVSTQPNDARIMLQALIDMPGEAGIFYIRHPGDAKGRIASMAFVHPPHVIGDGRRSVAELVASDPILNANAAIYRQRHPADWDRVLPTDAFHMLTNARSARLGAVYRDASDQITPELEAMIDRISHEIPDFHFGRFDIRFRSIAGLQQGRGFRIVELNGAGAEMLHIWAGDGTLRTAWRTLWQQYRTLFAIGAAMRRRGHRPVGLMGMIRLQRQQERLRRSYPPSS